MGIELTEQQRQALHENANRPVDIIDPQSQRCYVLLAREEYEQLRSLLPKETAPVSAQYCVSPGVLASQKAYWRDLPGLLKLKSSKRQWVAYHREERIGFASTCAELYQECKRRGIPVGDFYVDRLEPCALPPWEEEIIEA